MNMELEQGLERTKQETEPKKTFIVSAKDRVLRSTMALRVGFSLLVGTGAAIAQVDYFLKPKEVSAGHLNDCRAGVIVDEVNEIGAAKDEYSLWVVTPNAFDDKKVNREEILATAEIEDGKINGSDRFTWLMDSNTTRDGKAAWTALVFNPAALERAAQIPQINQILTIPPTLCSAFREVNIREIPLGRVQGDGDEFFPSGDGTPDVQPPVVVPPVVSPATPPQIVFPDEIKVNPGDLQAKIEEINEEDPYNIAPALILGLFILGGGVAAGLLAGRRKNEVRNEIQPARTSAPEPRETPPVRRNVVEPEPEPRSRPVIVPREQEPPSRAERTARTERELRGEVPEERRRETGNVAYPQRHDVRRHKEPEEKIIIRPGEPTKIIRTQVEKTRKEPYRETVVREQPKGVVHQETRTIEPEQKQNRSRSKKEQVEEEPIRPGEEIRIERVRRRNSNNNR